MIELFLLKYFLLLIKNAIYVSIVISGSFEHIICIYDIKLTKILLFNMNLGQINALMIKQN